MVAITSGSVSNHAAGCVPVAAASWQHSLTQLPAG